MVEIIRRKWCDDLEEMLQCPICMMIPIADIHQCSEGHIICINCKNQISVCVFCNQDWACRNRVVEDMCKLFGQMKASLIDEEEEFQKLLTPDTVSTACQTKKLQNASENSQEGPAGTYPCRLGTCNTRLYLYDQLIKHLSRDHPNKFHEFPQSGNLFEHSWTIEYTEIMTFDRAIKITDVGTFFLKLTMDVYGNLSGLVMMVQNATISKQYSYQLEVNCCAEHKGSVYSGEVITCRTHVTIIPEKSLQIKRAEVKRMMEHNKNFTCTVIIVTKPNVENDKPQQETKTKNPKKRNKSRSQSQGNGQNEPRPTSSSSLDTFV